MEGGFEGELGDGQGGHGVGLDMAAVALTENTRAVEVCDAPCMGRILVQKSIRMA